MNFYLQIVLCTDEILDELHVDNSESASSSGNSPRKRTGSTEIAPLVVDTDGNTDNYINKLDSPDVPNMSGAVGSVSGASSQRSAQSGDELIGNTSNAMDHMSPGTTPSRNRASSCSATKEYAVGLLNDEVDGLTNINHNSSSEQKYLYQEASDNGASDSRTRSSSRAGASNAWSPVAPRTLGHSGSGGDDAPRTLGHSGSCGDDDQIPSRLDSINAPSLVTDVNEIEHIHSDNGYISSEVVVTHSSSSPPLPTQHSATSFIDNTSAQFESMEDILEDI